MMRKPSLFLAVAFGLAAPMEPAGAAGSKAAVPEKPLATVEPDSCALAYHASLKRIAAEDLPRLRPATPLPPEPTGTAGIAPAQVDATLPGVPLFVPPSRQRNAADISALTAAVALARSKGRSTSGVSGAGSDTERAWIAARLREDLGDYLNQKPTPFLCSGVPAYLETLRRFTTRLGPAGDRRPAWIATQRGSAERSVKAADEATVKARANLPQTVAQTELRPGADLARSEIASAAQPVSIGDEAAILAAIDRLVAEARAAGLVFEPQAPQVTGATVAPPPVPSRPVLAKLASVRPMVVSARPLVRDRNVRLKLLAAFADLEMLDYLMKAGADVPDPVASAIGTVLDHVAQAHRTDCTCRN